MSPNFITGTAASLEETASLDPTIYLGAAVDTAIGGFLIKGWRTGSTTETCLVSNKVEGCPFALEETPGEPAESRLIISCIFRLLEEINLSSVTSHDGFENMCYIDCLITRE